MDNNFNIDNETMNKIKGFVDNGNLSGALSQISPEMIDNFSKMMAKQNNNNSNLENNNSVDNNSNLNSSNSNRNNNFNNTTNYNNTGNNSNSNNNNDSTNNSGFNLNNIDMNTIMKMSSAFGNMNQNKKDPRANLLNSLKPYLRDQKKR